MVVLFWTFVYDMLIYYKTWIYHCLIKLVKSPSLCSHTPNSVRISQSGRTGNRDVTRGEKKNEKEAPRDEETGTDPHEETERNENDPHKGEGMSETA